jgi:hypothetical protein
LTTDVAICISGQARITDIVMNSFREMIHGPLYKHFGKVDVFCHFWLNKSFDRYEWNYGEQITHEAVHRAFDGIPNTNFCLEDPINFFERKCIILAPIKEAPSYESQYQSLLRARDMMIESERGRSIPYKFVIRTRIDLIFKNIFLPQWLNNSDNIVCIPEREGHKWRGEEPPKPWSSQNWVPDQFWAGGRRPVVHLMSFLEGFGNKIYRPHMKNSIEVMMHRHLDRLRPSCRIKRIPLLYKIEKTTNNR